MPKSDIEIAREATMKPIADVGAEKLLSLIHISEPTRPY